MCRRVCAVAARVQRGGDCGGEPDERPHRVQRTVHAVQRAERRVPAGDRRRDGMRRCCWVGCSDLLILCRSKGSLHIRLAILVTSFPPIHLITSFSLTHIHLVFSSPHSLHIHLASSSCTVHTKSIPASIAFHMVCCGCTYTCVLHRTLPCSRTSSTHSAQGASPFSSGVRCT